MKQLQTRWITLRGRPISVLTQRPRRPSRRPFVKPNDTPVKPPKPPKGAGR